MSRTLKDKPSKLLWGDFTQDYIFLSNYTHIFGKTTKPKVRREINIKWAWSKGTPSWWTRLIMNRPERRANKLREREALFKDIEEFDFPDLGRKPHSYYY